jgi:Leucine-rich repeat (LRR) protein
MTKSELHELQLIIKHITQPNYDSIDSGINLLVKSGKIIFFEKILENCKIIDGCLIASRRYTVTAPRQPFIDYALWNIIGQKPKNVRVHRSLQKSHIKNVRLSEYESSLHCFHRIEKFPIGITFLNNIENLDLSSASVKKIPIEIERLIKLEKIELYNNQIKQFPAGLCKIETLKTINLSNNKIKVIPRDIIKLKNLQYLNLNSNAIITFPKGFKKLQELRNLSISHNKIEEIPLEICELVNLEIISLRNNRIKFIPDGFSNLQNITDVDLSGNKLISIPNLNSTMVKSLNLTRNKITILNDCIKNMTGLESLFLNENRELKLVEPGIASLSNLKNLELGQTGNLSPKPHVLNLNGRESIEKYFNKILYHYKLKSRDKIEKKNTTIEKNKYRKYRKYRHYNNDNNKPPKDIEGIISNLSNYLNSKEIDIIDIGISLTTSIANESVYNYIFRKWKINQDELSLMDYYNGFEFEQYRYQYYILLKLLSSKNNDLKIHRNISIENIKCLHYEFFEKRYPDFIFSFYNLTKIDFSLNNLDLTNDIHKLSYLQDIKLKQVNNLDVIQFDKFSDLKNLEVKKSTTKSHWSLENIKNLEKLSIDSVNAQSLTIKDNDNLLEISLYGLQIDQIEISNCRNLQKINITSCDFSNEFKFSSFPNLRELTIQRSSITGLMDLISKCSSLEKISIEMSGCLILDKSIANIKKIKILNLKDNGINYIPEEIGELEKLEYLNISKNNIKLIPNSLANCISLKYLDIRFQCGKTKAHNKLNDIPVEMFEIKTLKTIKITWSSLVFRKFKSKLSQSNLYQKSRIIANE